MLDEVLDHSVEVGMSQKDSLIFAILFVSALLLKLTEHFINQVLMFIGVTNFDDTLQETLKEGVLVNVLQIELKMLFEESLHRLEDDLQELQASLLVGLLARCLFLIGFESFNLFCLEDSLRSGGEDSHEDVLVELIVNKLIEGFQKL